MKNTHKQTGIFLSKLAVIAIGCSDGEVNTPVSSRSTDANATIPAKTREAVVRGMRVKYKIVDGMAVTGGDIVLGVVGKDGELLHEKQGKAIAPPENLATGASSYIFGKGGIDDSGLWLEWPGWKWPKYDFGEWGIGGCRISWFPDGNMPAEYTSAFRNAARWFNLNSYCRWVEEYNPQHSVRVVFDPNLDSDGKANVGRHCYYQSEFGEVRCSSSEVYVWLKSSEFSVIVHEMFHTLGFFHEHQRPDRDLFVDMKAWNDPDYDPLVPAFNAANALYFTNAYSDRSVMHYKGGCRWRNVLAFCGPWYCWGNILPKGYGDKNGVFECTNLPSWFEVQVGSDSPVYGDAASIAAMYPPPPNLPPPPPPRPDKCANFPMSMCDFGKKHECCENTGDPRYASDTVVFNHEYAWSNTKAYAAGDTVWIGSRWFRSLVARPAGAPSPVQDTVNWRGIYEPNRYWREGIEYLVSSLVEYNGKRYTAVAEHLSLAGLEPEGHPDLWFLMD